MRDRVLLRWVFDAEVLRAEVAALERGAWIPHFVPQNYDGAWTVLPLIAPAGAQHPVATIYADPNAASYVATPLLGRCPAFKRVLESFQCSLQAVRLMKLTPGSIVKPHRDHDLGVEFGRARLHVPIATNPEVEFVLNGTRVVMNEGECWYLDLSGPHSVANRGRTDRIHLVIDAVLNDWLNHQLESASSEPARDSRIAASLPPPIAPGPTSDLAGFQAAVWRDPDLQQQLRDTEDRAAFVALVIRLAAERGYTTTADEVDRAMREGRRRVRQP